MSDENTIKALLEEADIYRDRLDLEQRELIDQLSLLACKIDDANAVILEMEAQYDDVRNYVDSAKDHADRLGETVRSIGYHVLPEESKS